MKNKAVGAFYSFQTLETVFNTLTPSGFVMAKMRMGSRTALPEITRMKITGQFYTQNEKIILWHKV